MKFEDARKYSQTITAKKFWIVMTNGGGSHLYEGKAEKRFGEWVHYKRFAGWKDSCPPEKSIRCRTKGKKWEGVWLAQELTRTDWKIQIISNEVKLLLTQRNNYHNIYKK